MKTVKKKAHPEMFQKVKDNEKTFDLRLADWHIEQGDKLILQEWNPETKSYTGRELIKRVGFVGKTKDFDFWEPKEIDKYGYQIISLLD